MAALVGTMLFSCMQATRFQTNEANRRPLASEDGLGELQIRTYEGIFPELSGDSVQYRLTVESREFSSDGTFTLVRTRLGLDGSRHELPEKRGRRFTLRGTEENADAVVWQFLPEDGSEALNFLCGDDGTLLLLDVWQRKVTSGHGCILKENREIK